MNIIDAWKKAKEGDKIFRITGVRFDREDTLRQMIDVLSDEEQLQDETWEVERKPLVWEGEVKWSEVYQMPIPHNEDGFYVEFKQFIGKRTKIRIEEILED